MFFVVLRPDRQSLFKHVEEHLEKGGSVFLYNAACFSQQGPLDDLSFTSGLFAVFPDFFFLCFSSYTAPNLMNS